MFRSPGWLDDVWGTPLEQIWRDHLLALSIAQASNTPTTVRYGLVAPAGNAASSRLASAYSDLLSDAAAPTFEYHALEQLLDQAEGVLPHSGRFRVVRGHGAPLTASHVREIHRTVLPPPGQPSARYRTAVGSSGPRALERCASVSLTASVVVRAAKFVGASCRAGCGSTALHVTYLS